MSKETTLPASEPMASQDLLRKLDRLAPLLVTFGGVLASFVILALAGAGPFVLALSGTTLLVAILVSWTSLRVLSGDDTGGAPLLAHVYSSRAELEERKKLIFRALKDLESEHALGKIDEEDFALLSKRYRAQAKEIMKELDDELVPTWKEAEALVADYLRQKGIAEGAPDAEGKPKAGSKAPPASKRVEPVLADVACAKCQTANDLDARFCKKCGSSLVEGEPS